MKDRSIKALVDKSQATCYLSLPAQQQQWDYSLEQRILKAVHCCQHYSIIYHKDFCSAVVTDRLNVIKIAILCSLAPRSALFVLEQ